MCSVVSRKSLAASSGCSKYVTLTRYYTKEIYIHISSCFNIGKMPEPLNSMCMKCLNSKTWNTAWLNIHLEDTLPNERPFWYLYFRLEFIANYRNYRVQALVMSEWMVCDWQTRWLFRIPGLITLLKQRSILTPELIRNDHLLAFSGRNCPVRWLYTCSLWTCLSLNFILFQVPLSTYLSWCSSLHF